MCLNQARVTLQVNIDFETEPIGTSKGGKKVYFKNIWPSNKEIASVVKAVIVKSFERIHRSNLVGMGIIPLCFKPGEDAETLGLIGHEQYTIDLPSSVSDIKPGLDVAVVTGTGKSFACTVRFDTEVELAYYNHGGILPFVIRNLIDAKH